MKGFHLSIVTAALLLTPVVAHAQLPAHIEQFEKRVRPLLNEHCLKCHGASEADGGRKTPAGGLVLIDRDSLLRGGDTGPAIVPGQPGKSLLIQALTHQHDVRMPPRGKLSQRDIKELTSWVKNGAVWPDQGDIALQPGGTSQPGPNPDQRHWAFQQIRKVALPDLPPGTPPLSNEIDQFIVDKLLKQGLSLSPRAERRVLIRRITFNLTGLPPTPAEVEAFVGDTSPNAWEKVVDRLLDSPAYGERWARHWLDVVRYADTNGLDENTAFANAWRYRDYVIRSFNRDKPYNRFIKEQLAGDLLPHGHNTGLIATGMLVLGPKLLAEPDKDKMVMDIVDEQIDVVSKTFLGLTISCARCHDHKFDPITTRDYYALAGIFKSTSTMATLNTVAKVLERPLTLTDTPEVAAYRAEIAQLQKEVQQIEIRYSATPEKNTNTRRELHRQAEVRRSEIARLQLQIFPPRETPAVRDDARPTDVRIHIRGNHLTLGKSVPRGVPQFLAGQRSLTVPTTNSGRRELAEWIASAENPLTARVMVNRVWQHHFGEGIVRTPDNFGRLGDEPTHPELLDWLAKRFINDGWSLKKLHKFILLSDTYQQSSRISRAGTVPAEFAFLGIPMPALTVHDLADVDPENRLMGRFPRQRLEAEAIRDSILAVAGSLERTMKGSLYSGANLEYVVPVKYNTNRRSIYLPVVRNNVYDLFQAFDFVEPHVVTGKRATTVVPSQALFMMNNPFVQAQAKAFAELLLQHEGSTEERIALAYQRALSRLPLNSEVQRTVQFLERLDRALANSEPGSKARTIRVWQSWCQVLMSSSEFLTID